ncbi:uncharacterized protein [Diadema setosum]|uniref:uncharacterized protein n=1 Tax=Diadema setosum TaxID=31175 RepID=UPI003B3AD084
MDAENAGDVAHEVGVEKDLKQINDGLDVKQKIDKNSDDEQKTESHENADQVSTPPENDVQATLEQEGQGEVTEMHGRTEEDKEEAKGENEVDAEPPVGGAGEGDGGAGIKESVENCDAAGQEDVTQDGTVHNDAESTKVTTVSFASEVQVLNEDEFEDVHSIDAGGDNAGDVGLTTETLDVSHDNGEEEEKEKQAEVIDGVDDVPNLGGGEQSGESGGVKEAEESAQTTGEEATGDDGAVNVLVDGGENGACNLPEDQHVTVESCDTLAANEHEQAEIQTDSAPSLHLVEKETGDGKESLLQEAQVDKKDESNPEDVGLSDVSNPAETGQEPTDDVSAEARDDIQEATPAQDVSEAMQDTAEQQPVDPEHVGETAVEQQPSDAAMNETLQQFDAAEPEKDDALPIAEGDCGDLADGQLQQADEGIDEAGICRGEPQEAVVNEGSTAELLATKPDEDNNGVSEDHAQEAQIGRLEEEGNGDNMLGEVDQEELPGNHPALHDATAVEDGQTETTADDHKMEQEADPNMAAERSRESFTAEVEGRSETTTDGRPITGAPPGNISEVMEEASVLPLEVDMPEAEGDVHGFDMPPQMIAPYREPLPPIELAQDSRDIADSGMDMREGPSPFEVFAKVNAMHSHDGVPSIMRSDGILPQGMSPHHPPYSHSDYNPQSRGVSKLESVSRGTNLSRVQIARIPSPPAHVKAQMIADEERRASTRLSNRLPPSVMKMSTVMVSARKKAVKHRQASVYYEEKRHQKVLTLDECINSRPPMPFDLDGPGPWSYSPRNKPLYEDNAPEYSFGMKFPERGGGGRTAYAKTWFNSPNNFTNKTRFERRWPSPNNYGAGKSLLGRRIADKRTFPAFSIGVKSQFSISKRGSEHEPGPDQYQRQRSDPLIFRSAPSFSMGTRLDRVRLFGQPEITPAPNYYNPHVTYTSMKTSYPAFTIRGVRKPKNHALGPHATL